MQKVYATRGSAPLPPPPPPPPYDFFFLLVSLAAVRHEHFFKSEKKCVGVPPPAPLSDFFRAGATSIQISEAQKKHQKQDRPADTA